MDLFLIYGHGDLQLDGYTYSNFQSDIDDRKFTSGLCSFIIEVQSVGRVPNRVQLLIPLQRPSTLWHQMP